MHTATTETNRAWVGHWLMAVAALHTAFAAAMFHGTLLGMAGQGWFNSVGSDALRGAVAWFVLFGALLALLALAITPLERLGAAAALRALGWGLLALTACGLALMPASGFWLALPAVWSLVRRR
jgi:hypothetical protein